MGLPGLIGLQRVDNLTIISPIMRDVDWLGGLSCSRQISFTSNSITSLEGLSQVQAVIPAGEGPGLQLTSMTYLTGGTLGSLRQYGACTADNSSPWTSRILATIYEPGNPSMSSVFTVGAHPCWVGLTSCEQWRERERERERARSRIFVPFFRIGRKPGIFRKWGHTEKFQRIEGRFGKIEDETGAKIPTCGTMTGFRDCSGTPDRSDRVNPESLGVVSGTLRNIICRKMRALAAREILYFLWRKNGPVNVQSGPGSFMV